MKIKIGKLFLVLFIIVLPFSFVAATNLSYIPRVYLGGYAGADSNLLGKADILAPIFLTANNNFFAYAQGKYAYENRTWQDNTYTGSFGLGFRQIVKDVTVLGAYVFGDYTAATSGHNFWVINPGIESLSRNWDVRVNGYFPVSKTRWIDAGWANEFGDYHYVDFRRNEQWDHWYQYYQEVGFGGDAEVGRNLFTLKSVFKGILFKGFVNGYYYNMQHNDDVIGGGVRLTIQPNRSLTISLRDSYDNYEHNTFMVGVQLSFYDLFTDNKNEPINTQDLQRNLFVPIERNLATIGTGSSIPVTRSDKPEDVGQRLEHDNVWFFKQGAASSNTVQGSGTYENPFTAFTMEEYNYVKSKYPTIGATIDPYPLMYFNSGTYPLTDFGYRFSIPPGWGMYGWVMYGSPINRPAVGHKRPVFIGGIDLLQGNNTLDSIAIHNNSGNQGVGLNIQANNIYVNNIKVGALNSTTGYQTGIYMDNATATVTNSDIYGYSATGNAYGLKAENTSGGDVTMGNISGSTFTGSSISNNGYGLYAESEASTIINTISDSEFIGIGGYDGYGLHAESDSNFTIINKICDSKFIGTGYDGFGLWVWGGDSGVTINTISDSEFNGNGSGVAGCGIYAWGITDVTIGTISDSEFYGNGKNDGDGLRTFSTSNVIINKINNSKFVGNGNEFNGHGLYADGASVTIRTICGSKFTGTGTNGYGLYAQSDPSLGTTSIGYVSRNTFTASTVGIALLGNIVKINENNVMTGDDVLDELGPGNIFLPLGVTKALVNGV